MTKDELVEALRKLAFSTKDIVVALHEFCPESGKAEELRGAAEILLDWADAIIDEGENDNINARD